MKIMVDTGAWYALANRGDRHHDEARRFHSGSVGLEFVTTNAILMETWALMNARPGRWAAMTFWESLRRSQTPIVSVLPEDLERAWHIAREWPDQTFSAVDCTTFAAMERQGISHVFTFDAHFLVYRYGADRSRAFVRLP